MKKTFFRHIFISLLVVVCWAAILISIGAYSFLTTSVGAKMIVGCLTQAYAAGYDIKIGSLSGTIEKGLILKDIVVSHIPSIKGSSLQIQQLDVQVPLVYWKKLSVKVSNARLNFFSSDSLVFNGSIEDDQIQGNLFGNSVDAKEVVEDFGYHELARDIYGFISHVDFMVRGLAQSPSFSGHFMVDKFAYKDTQLSDGFGHLDLRIVSLGEIPDMQGTIVMESALVKTMRINIDLATSRADFKGNVTNPLLDIHGATKIDDKLIDMAIKGSLQKPLLLLSSDPPMSQNEIFATLATKGWSGVNDEKSQVFLLRRSLTDSFNVGMRLAEQPDKLGQTRMLGFSKSIEGQMNVTDKFSLNIAKKYFGTGTDTVGAAGSQQTDKDNETEFYLQFKERF